MKWYRERRTRKRKKQREGGELKRSRRTVMPR
jgi:hypothetical protein